MNYKNQSRELRALTGANNENMLQKRTRGRFSKPDNTDKGIESSNSKKLRKDLTDLSTQQ